MKTFLTTTAALLALATPAFAEGDVANGEKEFKKCKSCHMIVSPEGEEIMKGGKTGPNLYGVIGRVAGSVEDFKYGEGLMAAKAAEFAWTEESIAAFITDPKAWLSDNGYDSKTKMTFKMKKDQADLAAYLASVSPTE